MKAKIFILLIFLLLISCDSSTVYSKFDSGFSKNRWQKTDVKTYEFTIESEQFYEIIFDFSHLYDYQFISVPIDFVLENPSGKLEKFTIDLMIKNSLGKQVADCSGDICDLKFKIKENLKLEKGNYKIQISNGFKGDYLPNVLGIGIEVKDCKEN